MKQGKRKPTAQKQDSREGAIHFCRPNPEDDGLEETLTEEGKLRSRVAELEQALSAALGERDDAGWFVLCEDDDGNRYWRGACGPDDKDESEFDVGEPLVLDPAHWPIGTRVETTVPERQSGR